MGIRGRGGREEQEILLIIFKFGNHSGCLVVVVFVTTVTNVVLVRESRGVWLGYLNIRTVSFLYQVKAEYGVRRVVLVR